MGELHWKTGYAAVLLCATTAIALPAQTFTVLDSFGGSATIGASPYASLVQAVNASLYGTTSGGGTNNAGTIFRITPGGTLATVYQFCSRDSCADGSTPYAGLVQAPDGSFYGTTNQGGMLSPADCTDGCGTVFKVTPSGTLTTLHAFCAQLSCPDGGSPFGGLVLGADGDFYGTAQFYGADGAEFAGGTIFRLTPGGKLTTLYSFCSKSDCADGEQPRAGLVQSPDGDFYGTTIAGGSSACTGGCGTVFKVTPGGVLTTLHRFESADGSFPGAALVLADDGNFYGTTAGGGANGFGTVFKISPKGSVTTLYSFCSQSGCTDGADPEAALIQATDGELYGTTSQGGVRGSYGTIFRISLSGALTTIHKFCSQSGCVDGASPHGGLVQDTNGKFYGTTVSGGINSFYGTVFSLSAGLLPFVEIQPTSGTVGKTVTILGTDLLGATGVTFNGTDAAFTVQSKCAIKATVPEGATTGPVQVVTRSGTLISNVNFRVLP